MTARTRLHQAQPGGSWGFGANDAVGSEVCHEDAVVERCSSMRRRAHGSVTRFVLSVMVGFALLLEARTARADDLQQFELGKTRFNAGEYDRAAERFATMLDPTQPPCQSVPTDVTSACRLTDPDVIERARTFYAASLVALDRVDDADAQIAEILRKNPQFSPDPAAFPQKVVDRFTIVRAELRQELEAEQEKRAQKEREQRLAADRAKQAEERWLAAVLRAASEERVVVKNSRYIAALPFGIGQFQNGNRSLGTALAISQSIFAATSIAASAMNTYYLKYGLPEQTEAERQFSKSGQLISGLINQISFGAFAALAVTGIVQAQVAFVPEKVVIHKRPVPPRPTATSLQIVPTFGLSPNMVGVGVSGVF